MNTPLKQIRHTTHMRYIERLARMLMRLEKRENIFPWIRLGVLIAGGIFTFLAFQYGTDWLGRGVLVFSFAIFMGVVFLHRRINKKIKRCKLLINHTTSQVSRMNLDWSNIPLAAIDNPDAHHPFEIDLNITGPRSLMHLLDTAVSRGGSLRLRQWLLTLTPDVPDINYRQELVQELTDLPGLRKQLSLISKIEHKDGEPPLDGEPLLNWLEKQPKQASLKNSTLTLAILAIINISLFLLNIFSFLPPFWIISFIIYSAIYLFKYQSFRDLFDDAYDLWHELGNFRPLLIYLEKYPYPPNSAIGRLCAVFSKPETTPSRLLRKIYFIASAASIQRNQIIWLLLNILVPWDLFFACQLENSKFTLRQWLPKWLDTFYEIEALSSLANYAYLNPDLQFPKIVSLSDASKLPLMQGQDIGHPLLRDEARVCNDFTLDHLGEVAIITGSNMSGKSTFLRTLGINLVMAYCGSVVVARQMQGVPFRIFTCIHLSDSLTDGISYFYAEVRRLKELLDALEMESPYPLFFLIDEIFRGTNQHERQEGSAAYIRALAGKNGAGVIATHDLTLAELAEQIDALHNYHFRDEVLDGRMVFDYRIRPGASPTTNALKIMKLEGLPV